MQRDIDPSEVTETWKPVIGYEGMYEVSDMGRVRRAGRNPVSRWSKEENRILLPQLNVKQGYFYVGLWNGIKRKSVKVSRLVVAAFQGEPIPEGWDVHHKNRNRQDDRLENLEELPSPVHHSREVHTPVVGEQHHVSKLTEEIVLRIRDVYCRGKSGSGYGSLGIRFGVSTRTIRNVLTRRPWGHL